MGLFDKVFGGFTDFLQSLKANIAELVSDAKKFMQGDIFDAAMATVVCVGYADGTFDAQEKMAALKFVQTHPTMEGHSADEVKKAFDKYADIFTLDVAMGKDEAMKAIRKVADSPVDARNVIIRVGCLIGASDGNFDDNEKAVMREICGVLGLNKTQFGL